MTIGGGSMSITLDHKGVHSVILRHLTRILCLFRKYLSCPNIFTSVGVGLSFMFDIWGKKTLKFMTLQM